MQRIRSFQMEMRAACCAFAVLLLLGGAGSAAAVPHEKPSPEHPRVGVHFAFGGGTYKAGMGGIGVTAAVTRDAGIPVLGFRFSYVDESVVQSFTPNFTLFGPPPPKRVGSAFECAALTGMAGGWLLGRSTLCLGVAYASGAVSGPGSAVRMRRKDYAGFGLALDIRHRFGDAGGFEIGFDGVTGERYNSMSLWMGFAVTFH